MQIPCQNRTRQSWFSRCKTCLLFECTRERCMVRVGVWLFKLAGEIRLAPRDGHPRIATKASLNRNYSRQRPYCKIQCEQQRDVTIAIELIVETTNEKPAFDRSKSPDSPCRSIEHRRRQLLLPRPIKRCAHQQSPTPLRRYAGAIARLLIYAPDSTDSDTSTNRDRASSPQTAAAVLVIVEHSSAK